MINPRRSPDQKNKNSLHFENEPVSFRHNYGSASIIEEAFGSFGSMSLSRRQGSEVTSPAGTQASQSLSTLQYGVIARWALAAHRPVPCNTLRKEKKNIFWTSVASHDRLLHNGTVKRRRGWHVASADEALRRIIDSTVPPSAGWHFLPPLILYQ